MASLFLTKPVERLIAETQERQRSLRRVLGPIDLIALGIGATIGAGIFATIGTAAAGDAVRQGAGPALILSFVLTAIVCAFTGLCYAELASLVPVSGSAYTFTYATLGELIAWIIGWDLILEYAIGNVAVAISWANYFNTLLSGFGLNLPAWLTVDYRTAAQKMPDVIAGAPHVLGVPIVFNLLAIGIVAVLSVLLVWGVRESARATAVMVVIKLLVLGLFCFVGIRFIKPENWQPFAPNGFGGIAAAAAIIFFAYIGFDAVSTCAEETRRPGRDLPIGILGSLVVSTLIYVVVAVVFTGLVPFRVAAKPERLRAGGAVDGSPASRRPLRHDRWPGGLRLGRRTYGRAAGFSTRPGEDLHGHGPRRPAAGIAGPHPSAVPHAARRDDPDGRRRGRPGRRSRTSTRWWTSRISERSSRSCWSVSASRSCVSRPLTARVPSAYRSAPS